jgi:hypothetical protein
VKTMVVIQLMGACSALAAELFCISGLPSKTRGKVGLVYRGPGDPARES